MRTRACKVWLTVCFLAALALGSTSAFAQAPASQQPPPPPPPQGGGPHEGFGIQLGGGPVFSNFDDVQGLHFESKTGYLVGILMGGNRGGAVGVEGDILYGQKGVKINGLDFNQNVIHVPVMLKINGGSSSVNGLSFFGMGGGFFDWQFSSKIGNVDISEDTDGYEVGWVLGGGVEVLRFSIQARYMKGLREIGKNFDVANSIDSKSKAFVVLFAFRLN